MSFSVHCETTGREWNGSSLNQVFGQRSNVFRPTHWQMLLDVLKFRWGSPAVLEALSDSVTVEQWMAQNRLARRSAAISYLSAHRCGLVAQAILPSS